MWMLHAEGEEPVLYPSYEEAHAAASLGGVPFRLVQWSGF